jgi:putative endopeptidase
MRPLVTRLTARSAAFALTITSLAALPILRAHAQSSALERTVDPMVVPGDDFFGYANGAWLKATTVPAGTERWGARQEIAATTGRRITALLEEARSAPQGSLARKVADFRAAYMDTATIETKGLAALQPLLDRIDRVRDRAGLVRFLGSELRADVDPLNWGIYRSSGLLGLAVTEGNNGEPTYVAYLVQGGLGLRDRDHYLDPDPAKAAVRAKYRLYVERMLDLAGLDRAAERAARVIELETAIARSHGTREASARDQNADNRWTRDDFAHRAPGMDWGAYFAAAGMGHQQEFIAWQPSAVTGMAALVGSHSMAGWKDYLRFHVLDRYADLLPRSLANETLALRAAVGMTPAPDTPRADRALAATETAMGEALGRMYSERYFSAPQKARVRRIVTEVTAAFIRRVEAADWMTPATKAVALEKLRSLYVGIGYPERWQDWSDLTVDPRDAFGNVRRAEERTFRQTVGRLGTPVDRTAWQMLPQMPGAILVFQLNAYDFSAALLQAPKFDSAASDAAAYGAIGAIIGHDVSHFVDALGADYELSGRARRWWTPEDSVRYDALTQRVDDQYAAYRPMVDAAIDGRRTRVENVADLAGLAAAFDAYRASLGTRASDRAEVRRMDREFFLAFAQGWRSKLTERGLRVQLATDNHAPDRYRVATVRNLDAWYAAFDVTPGQALYLPPEARVRVW